MNQEHGGWIPSRQFPETGESMPQDTEWDTKQGHEDICPQCKGPIIRGGICSSAPISIDGGEPLPRIPHKAEVNCADCGVVPGSCHHYACSMEVCPLCKRIGDCWDCVCRTEIPEYKNPSMQQRELEK